MLYPVMDSSPLGTVGAIQDTLITPGLSTGTAMTVLSVGAGATAKTGGKGKHNEQESAGVLQECK